MVNRALEIALLSMPKFMAGNEPVLLPSHEKSPLKKYNDNFYMIRVEGKIYI